MTSVGLSLGASNVRALAGVPTGPISLHMLLNKSAYTPPSLGTSFYDGGVSGSAFICDLVGCAVAGTYPLLNIHIDIVASSPSPFTATININDHTWPQVNISAFGVGYGVFNVTVTDAIGSHFVGQVTAQYEGI